MSVLRQANILGQQRLDVPHIRAVESSIAADFDLLAGTIMAGDKALIVKGFEIISPATAVGSPATDLQLLVANSVVMHPLASEHGTIFSVAADTAAETLSTTNVNVEGSFTAGQVNYVGLDLRRTADDSTADLVMFMDANTLIETPKSVPLARILAYKIIISTTDFASTPYILPVAKITTNSTNTVTVVEDARPMSFRLGSGGSVPNRYNAFPWVSGRQENTSGAVFTGGDKGIGSMKDWMDSVMTRLWEVGGGQYWYSPTADREMKMIFGQPVIIATGDNFQWTLGSQTLQWMSLQVSFGNSPVAYNTVIDGSAILADNQCLYVDVDRTALSNLTAVVADLTTLGSPTIPGSRFVIAWRRGAYMFIRDRMYEVGRTINVANTVIYGTVRLKYVATNPADPTVLAMQVNGAYVNIADGGNSAAFIGTGNGTGSGFFGTGGTSNGPGLYGVGGATNGAGVSGQGTGSGAGGTFTGGASGPGTYSFGQGNNPGGWFTGGASGGSGLVGTAGIGGFFSSGVSGNAAQTTNSYGGSFFGFTPQVNTQAGGVGVWIQGGTGGNQGTGGSNTNAGGLGGYVFGGNGASSTSTGGAGGAGLQILGGWGGSADSGLAAGGAGGRGATITGGAGGNTTTPVNAGTGGIGIFVTGGSGGTISGGTKGNGGHGIQVVGGEGGSTSGYGIIATGGASLNAVGGGGIDATGGNGPYGGIGGTFTGGVASSTASYGWGVVGTGGANSLSNGGPFPSVPQAGPTTGVVGLGGLGTMGGDGVQGFGRATNFPRSGGYFAGNFPTLTNIAGGIGAVAQGGSAGAGNANGGAGFLGTGGEGIGSGVGGVGGFFQGGTGAKGAHIKSGSGNADALLVEPLGNGRGIYVVMPSGGTGVGIEAVANGPVSSNPAYFNQVGSGYGVEFWHDGTGANPTAEFYGNGGNAVYAENSHSTVASIKINNFYGLNGKALEIAQGHLRFTHTNPISSHGFTNALTSKNVVKAWAWVQFGATKQIKAGFNVSNTVDANSAVGDIYFTNALSDNFCGAVVCSSGDYPEVSWAAQAVYTGGVTISARFHPNSAGAQTIIDLTGSAWLCCVIVYGAQ